jgi:hypothetical protein
MTCNFIGVWKVARSYDKNIPPCPEAFSEPEWAVLLFGGEKCQKCGMNKAEIDFQICRRLCRDCKAGQYVFMLLICSDIEWFSAGLSANEGFRMTPK